MVIDRIYLGDAFGWETESTAQVAIAQLREEKIIRTDKCPKAQLIKNASLQWEPNLLKILGYLPIINLITGIVAISLTESSWELGPDHVTRWRVRGVAMIVGGPLLFIVDLIKFIYDCYIVNQYQTAHPQFLEAFNPPHGHTIAYWPGHPIYCVIERACT